MIQSNKKTKRFIRSQRFWLIPIFRICHMFTTFIWHVAFVFMLDAPPDTTCNLNLWSSSICCKSNALPLSYQVDWFLDYCRCFSLLTGVQKKLNRRDLERYTPEQRLRHDVRQTACRAQRLDWWKVQIWGREKTRACVRWKRFGTTRTLPGLWAIVGHLQNPRAAG